MTITLTGIDLRPLTIPATTGSADAADFIEMVRVRNAVYAEITGNDDESLTAEALLPHYQPDPDETRHMWVVVRDGSIIGRVGVDIPHEAGSRNAYWLIELLRAHHGLGIGSQAYQLVERTAREHGRTVLQSWADHPDAPGERLAAPTGFGDIPRDHAARFYQRHGYALGQIERKSVLDFAVAMPLVEKHHAEALQAAVGYRVVQWQVPTPVEYREGYAWVKSRMSTDVPAADLEFDEETWDAARIERHDRRYVEGGHTVLATAAQHTGSGELVAFNELVVGADLSAATHQEDTLVLKEHRGHRLGMLVKCAGLTTWHTQVAPASPRVITFNAEENRPMLDINEAIGFAPVSYSAGWKKVLQ